MSKDRLAQLSIKELTDLAEARNDAKNAMADSRENRMLMLKLNEKVDGITADLSDIKGEVKVINAQLKNMSDLYAKEFKRVDDMEDNNKQLAEDQHVMKAKLKIYVAIGMFVLGIVQSIVFIYINKFII